VRLRRVDQSDLSIFEFDYDLTFMVFFLSPDEKIYSRYGGRDSKNADNRQSLEGLRYTMESVLRMHRQRSTDFAPRQETKPHFIREVANNVRRGCMHCHQVKETLNDQLMASGAWTRERVWRYPLPENLGFRLEVDRGNVVEHVTPDSVASRIGLQAGDILTRLGGAPVHSFADAQFALDHAADGGKLGIDWVRGGAVSQGTLQLTPGWKKTDVSWRASMRRLVPDLPLYGDDLTDSEKKSLGLSNNRLAFRQNERVHSRAKEAGIRAGDIIVGVDGRVLEMGVDDFLRFIQSEYVVGDTINLGVVRDGKPFMVPLVLSVRQ
jgi:membrane-associated protease RseP (regulator of RpoE activity)